MSKILAVAANTAREAVRDRILYLLLFFSIVMMAASGVLSHLAIGEPEKIILDVGLGSISFFSVLMAAFMGIGLISKEIERRTIYAVVTKPIGRGAFVVGKFLGMLGTIGLIEIVMTGMFAATLHYWEISLDRGCLVAIGLSFVEAAVMLSAALVFSAVASPMLATMFTLATYAVGHWLDSIAGLVRRLPPGGTKAVLSVLYHGFPNLERLNVKSEVVFMEPGTAAELTSRFWGAAGYGAAYTVGLLALAVLAYRRKDFV